MLRITLLAALLALVSSVPGFTAPRRPVRSRASYNKYHYSDGRENPKPVPPYKPPAPPARWTGADPTIKGPVVTAAPNRPVPKDKPHPRRR